MIEAYIRRALVAMLLALGATSATVVPVGATEQDAALTRADVERASLFYPANVRKLVRNAAPVPNWIAGGDRFWYRHEIEGGFRFVTVDAATGRRRAVV